MASTSGRAAAHKPGRSSRVQVDAALFEPPPFQPAKLSVQYLAGSSVGSSSSSSAYAAAAQQPLPRCRRYTLTHNDITGALQLSIGSEYNQRQVQGFYTRILRDEITAEWLFGRPATAESSSTSEAATATATRVAPPAELHIYCHVSGEERWLAPPQLRNFIFRREMNLVLDTFLYADRQLLQCFPDLLRAKVYVHFQSDVQDLDLREYWGVLGERASWRRMPKGVLARLKLLLFGFPAVPHQRPRHALTHQQQQQGVGGSEQPAVAMAAAATAGSDDVVTGAVSAVADSLATSTAAAATAPAGSSSSSKAQHQWQPQAELAVEATRPVALSLQEQRQVQAHQHSADSTQQQQDGAEQQPQQQACCSGSEADQHSSSISSSAAMLCQEQQHCPAQQEGEPGSHTGEPQPHQQQLVSSTHQQQQPQEQEQPRQPAPHTQLQQQLEQFEQQAAVGGDAGLQEYGRWSVQPPLSQQQQEVQQLLVSASATYRSAASSSSNVLPAAMLGAPSALQFALLQQQPEQMLLRTVGCAAVMATAAQAVVDAASVGGPAGRCQ